MSGGVNLRSSPLSGGCYHSSQMTASWVLVFAATVGVVGATAQSRSASVTGRVRDIAGTAVPEAQVEIWLEKTPDKISRGRTDESGAFAFDGLTRGEHSLSVASQGFNSLTVTSIPVSRGERTTLPVLELSVGSFCGDGATVEYLRFLPLKDASGDWSGTVLLNEGGMRHAKVAIGEVEVTLQCGKGSPCRTTRSDSQGRFSYSNLAPGTYDIHAERRGFYPELISGFRVLSGYEQVYVPILLERCFQGNCDPALRPEKPLRVCH